MGDRSGIEWTEATWNPVTGCTKVSAGCKNCYAERDWVRLRANQKSIYFGRACTGTNIRFEFLPRGDEEMNLKELIDHIAKGTELPKSHVRDVLDYLGCTAARQLTAGGEVNLPHIGRLHVEDRAARRGRNPLTGAPIDIPERRVVKLKVTEPLKRAVA